MIPDRWHLLLPNDGISRRNFIVRDYILTDPVLSARGCLRHIPVKFLYLPHSRKLLFLFRSTLCRYDGWIGERATNRREITFYLSYYIQQMKSIVAAIIA